MLAKSGIGAMAALFLIVAIGNMSTSVTASDELCTSHCTDWSDWSRCHVDYKANLVDTTRSRECDSDAALCDTEESKQCEVTDITCPEDYTRTKLGFCFYFNVNKKQRGIAEYYCTHSGGHLANINSQIKLDELPQVPFPNGRHKYWIWIDGERESLTSPWRYHSEPTPQSANFTNWDVVWQEPSNDDDFKLCTVALYREWDKRSWLWKTERCFYEQESLCEYV